MRSKYKTCTVESSLVIVQNKPDSWIGCTFKPCKMVMPQANGQINILRNVPLILQIKRPYLSCRRSSGKRKVSGKVLTKGEWCKCYRMKTEIGGSYIVLVYPFILEAERQFISFKHLIVNLIFKADSSLLKSYKSPQAIRIWYCNCPKSRYCFCSEKTIRSCLKHIIPSIIIIIYSGYYI